MYFINYQLLLPVVTCNLYITNYYFLVSSLLVVLGSTPPSITDESFHEYVDDGFTNSSIRDPCGILWYIPLESHHDQLATYHLSRQEMAARDTHVSYARRRDDDHITRCYHPWPPYRWTNSH